MCSLRSNSLRLTLLMYVSFYVSFFNKKVFKKIQFSSKCLQEINCHNMLHVSAVNNIDIGIIKGIFNTYSRKNSESTDSMVRWGRTYCFCVYVCVLQFSYYYSVVFPLGYSYPVDTGALNDLYVTPQELLEIIEWDFKVSEILRWCTWQNGLFKIPGLEKPRNTLSFVWLNINQADTFLFKSLTKLKQLEHTL